MPLLGVGAAADAAGSLQHAGGDIGHDPHHGNGRGEGGLVIGRGLTRRNGDHQLLGAQVRCREGQHVGQHLGLDRQHHHVGALHQRGDIGHGHQAHFGGQRFGFAEGSVVAEDAARGEAAAAHHAAYDGRGQVAKADESVFHIGSPLVFLFGGIIAYTGQNCKFMVSAHHQSTTLVI